MLVAGSRDVFIFPLAWETSAYLKAELKDPTEKERMREWKIKTLGKLKEVVSERIKDTSFKDSKSWPWKDVKALFFFW